MGIRRRSRRPNRFTYSLWDGTQRDDLLTADELFSNLTDDLAYHGDPNAALRNLLHEGFDVGDRHIEGLREILDKLRERREQLLESGDLDGVYGELSERLDDIVEMERSHLDSDGAQPEAQLELDLLPDGLADRVQALRGYDFSSPEAAEALEQLLEDLKEQTLNQVFEGMADAMGEMTPEDIARMRDMLAELNAMIAARQVAEEPDFEGFMSRYGDFFPENPQTLDELLEVIARRMAAAQAMLNSMSPEQREQLAQLSSDLFDDLDMQWELSQLGQGLAQAFPDLPWNSNFTPSGVDPLGLSEAIDLMNELGDIDALERMLRGASDPGGLSEVDMDRARELIGPDSAEALEQLSQMVDLLEEAGLINRSEGALEMTPKAQRQVGQSILREISSKLDADRFGRHSTSLSGIGHERHESTKPYEFGDSFNLDISKTVHNAVRRSGSGVPVRLDQEDFEVETTERQTRMATVLMLDLSLSMPMRDNFLPAKKVAIALQSLISGMYPQDYLGIVTFSEVAREVDAKDLPTLSWDYVYGTNMQHGLQLARRMLARHSGTKQVVMITDGEPTAYITESGQPVFNYPPTRETIDLTLAEVHKLTREQIVMNVFTLDTTPQLEAFVKRMTQMNGGRTFVTDKRNVGEYVLFDFMSRRRAS